MPKEGSRWVGRWAGMGSPFIWAVRGVTGHGIFITCPESHSTGHLLSLEKFKQDYKEVA